jgi:TolB-like protein
VEVAAFAPLETDPQTRDLSARLTDQVTGVLKDNVVGISLADASRADGQGADLRVKGTVSRDGGDWRVRAWLEDARRGVTLWSQEFEQPTSQESALQLQAAVAVAEVVDDATAGLQEKAARRDPRALALFLQSFDAIKNPTLMNGGGLDRLEEAVARAPDFVGARATLSSALLYESVTGARSDRKLLAQRARLEAETAIRRDAAAAGAAYYTLALMARVQAPDDLAAAENVLIEGSAKAPRFPYLYMRRCRFLTEVGLDHDALGYCQRALALDPLAAPLGFRYGEALYAAGSPELAARAIDNAARFHPEHPEIRRVQFEIAAFSGNPNTAAILLHRPTEGAPYSWTPSPEGMQAMDLFLAARKSGAAQDADKALTAMYAAVLHHGLKHRYFIFAAAALGRLDDAFAMLEQIAKLPGPMLASDPGFLFDGPAAALHRDPRFWPLAAQAGFARYWRVRGVLPDFCSDPTLPYDCRAEAARVAGVAPAKAQP